MKNALALGFGHVVFNAGLAAGAAAWAVSGGPGERSAQAATAPTAPTAATMTEGADRDRSPALRIGDARVVEAHVDPMVPVRVKTEGRTVALVFARSHGDHELVHLDGASLLPVSSDQRVAAEPAWASSEGAVRVVLDHNRFVVCWRRGDAEHGYRMIAQAWTGGGYPIGRPVVISPREADVLGAPLAVAVDGNRAVVAFAASAGDRVELLAVALQVL
jgi:hypothetical protein